MSLTIQPHMLLLNSHDSAMFHIIISVKSNLKILSQYKFLSGLIGYLNLELVFNLSTTFLFYNQQVFFLFYQSFFQLYEISFFFFTDYFWDFFIFYFCIFNRLIACSFLFCKIFSIYIIFLLIYYVFLWVKELEFSFQEFQLSTQECIIQTVYSQLHCVCIYLEFLGSVLPTGCRYSIAWFHLYE